MILFIQMIFSSSIQTLLSVPESHQFSPFVKKESRTLPPVGNFTLPRRKLFSDFSCKDTTKSVVIIRYL